MDEIFYATKFEQFSHPPKKSCNYPKFEQQYFTVDLCVKKDAEGMGNSVDPDQTALYVRKLQIIMVVRFHIFTKYFTYICPG